MIRLITSITILFLTFFFIMPVSYGQTTYHSCENWKVFLNADTIPLNCISDTSYIAHHANPDCDYLTLIKIKGQPIKGKIYFFSNNDYPLPLTTYKLGEKTIIKLKNIAKSYSKGARHKIKVQVVEISDKTIRPIIIVDFSSNK
jgi:hypothetical protein